MPHANNLMTALIIRFNIRVPCNGNRLIFPDCVELKVNFETLRRLPFG